MPLVGVYRQDENLHEDAAMECFVLEIDRPELVVDQRLPRNGITCEYGEITDVSWAVDRSGTGMNIPVGISL